MTIGQAYSEVLTPREQQALLQACDWLIDHAFDEFASINEPKDVLDTVLGSHLPERYTYRYTPLFYKKFAVCVMTVGWKLAQPSPSASRDQAADSRTQRGANSTRLRRGQGSLPPSPGWIAS